LAPNVTEIIFALNAGDRLKGVTVFCDYPPETQKIKKIGDFINPSIEKIISLSPEIVFAVVPIHTTVTEKLRALGIHVITLKDPETIEEIYQEIDSIGKALKKEKEAERLISHIKREFNKLKPTSWGLKVYIEISENPYVTVGKYSYLNDLFKKLGYKNIFNDIKEKYPVVNAEEIIKRNPDAIVILHPKATDVLKRPGWRRISAVKNRKIVKDVDYSVFLRPGPRILEAARIIQEKLR